jgi:hypothetical protein
MWAHCLLYLDLQQLEIASLLQTNEFALPGLMALQQWRKTLPQLQRYAKWYRTQTTSMRQVDHDALTVTVTVTGLGRLPSCSLSIGGCTLSIGGCTLLARVAQGCTAVVENLEVLYTTRAGPVHPSHLDPLEGTELLARLHCLALGSFQSWNGGNLNSRPTRMYFASCFF